MIFTSRFSGVFEKRNQVKRSKMMGHYFVLKKNVLIPGSGIDCPSLTSTCTMTIVPTLHVQSQKRENDKLFSKEELAEMYGCKLYEESSVELGTGQGELSGVIDVCLTKMKLGEKVQFSVKIIKSMEVLATNDIVTFELTLHSFVAGPPLYKLACKDCLDVAAFCKEVGGKMFNQKKLFVASCFYSRALKYLFLCHSLKKDQTQFYENLLLLCLSNLAACQLKRNLYQSVVKNCTDALQLDPFFVKALYRRASAYFAMNDFHNALDDISSGLKSDSSNKAFNNLLMEVKQKKVKEDKKLGERIKVLFS